MTLEEADNLLDQWGRWSSNELKRLDASRSKWQIDYRPSFDPSHPADDCEVEPDELLMLDVDTALGIVRMNNPKHFYIIKGRYVHTESYAYYQLDAAKRSFISAFRSPLEDENTLARELKMG